MGGTFTDAVMVAADGSMRIAKRFARRPSGSRPGSWTGCARCWSGPAPQRRTPRHLAHGSTVATNAIVQRRLARTALITNAGFPRRPRRSGRRCARASTTCGRRSRSRVVPRELCVRRTRTDWPRRRRVLEPLDEAARAGGDRARSARREIEAVAVVFLLLVPNPDHERRVGEILAAELPERCRSSLSSPRGAGVSRIPASVHHGAERLAPAARRRLRAGGSSEPSPPTGVHVPLHLMQSNGGVAHRRSRRRASRRAGGIRPGGRRHRQRAPGRAGGRADALDLRHGRHHRRHRPCRSTDTRSCGSRASSRHCPSTSRRSTCSRIGAGGGSIARVDEFGSLTVGPASAGADPGPAAYGRGGKRADRHRCPRRARHARPPSGARRAGVPLDDEPAQLAVASAVAAPLGLGVEEAAVAILRVANANMANALRVMSIARGHDPRALRARRHSAAPGRCTPARIADELGIPARRDPALPRA